MSLYEDLQSRDVLPENIVVAMEDVLLHYHGAEYADIIGRRRLARKNDKDAMEGYMKRLAERPDIAWRAVVMDDCCRDMARRLAEPQWGPIL